MASKTANILACVEPEVKEEAESIMNQLGIPASVVINMLYKQIIIKRKIPFDISLPVPMKSREEMSDEEFDRIMQTGLNEAYSNKSEPAADALKKLRKEVLSWR